MMKRIALGLVMVLMVGRANAADCSAECDDCPQVAPTCSASCGLIALCFDGSCLGPDVQCCCRTDTKDLCLGAPCSAPPGGGFLPKSEMDDWAVLKYIQGSSVEVVYASRSAFASGLVEAEESFPADRDLTKLTLAPRNGHAVDLDRTTQQKFVKDLRLLLTKVVGGHELQTEEMFLFRVDRRARVALATDPALGELMTQPVADSIWRTFGQSQGHYFDYVWVSVGETPGNLSVFHTRFSRR